MNDELSDEQWLAGLRNGVRKMWSGPQDTPEVDEPADSDIPDTKRRLGLVGGLGCAAVVSSVAALIIASAAPQHPGPVRPAAVTQPPMRTATPAPTTKAADLAIPFRPAASCPRGASTNPAGLAAAKPVPWICVHKAEAQPLHVTLLGADSHEHSWVVTGFAVTPGDNRPPDVNGADPWLAHRCVKLIRLIFNDVEHAQPVDLDTQCMRGEVHVAVPPVTASQVTVVFRETACPIPGQPTPDEHPNVDLVFPSDDPKRPAPTRCGPAADGTFAVGSLTFNGHEGT